MNWAVTNAGTHSFNFFTGGLLRPSVAYMDFDRNGSGFADDEHYEKAAKGLKIVGAEAAGLGAVIALETHNCYLHDLPKACSKLLKMVDMDNVGVNYDHGNIFINKNGSSIEEVLNIIGDKILYVHLKNMFVPFDKSFFLSTRLEEGHIDTMDVVKRLKERNFNGVLCTEYACTGDGIIAAKRDGDYLKF
ncbi:MAG: TIM barrel protein, partial [Kiritimatiellaeota bacterium]|nr:TIM barrel protein [Kiritimatiellota bacterium]